MSKKYREVAQLGRALRSGRRGRRFKSCLPDQYTNGTFDISKVLFLRSLPFIYCILSKFQYEMDTAPFLGVRITDNSSL